MFYLWLIGLIVRPVLENFTVQLLTLSVLVFSESVGGKGIEFSYVLMKCQ